MSDDKRNVIDKYKGWMQELIREDVKKKTFPFAVMMAQVVGDFNFSSVIRSANFFGASEVFYYGRKKFDRRGAQGAYHYTDVKFLASMDEIKILKEKYSFVALENNIEREMVSLSSFSWSEEKPPIILLGEEGQGIEKEILDLCDFFVEIPGFGSVRSLNLGCAGSIAMYDFVSKYTRAY